MMGIKCGPMGDDSVKGEQMKTNGPNDEIRETGASQDNLQRLEEERKHLETLFADRINFYLVFAAGVLAFLFAEQHPQKMLRPALWTVTIVSVLTIVALVRTLWLVMMVLHDIDKCQNAPYARMQAKVPRFLPNANYLLLVLPIALTAFFAYALYIG